jgi:hypothetical protein
LIHGTGMSGTLETRTETMDPARYMAISSLRFFPECRNLPLKVNPAALSIDPLIRPGKRHLGGVAISQCHPGLHDIMKLKGFQLHLGPEISINSHETKSWSKFKS